MRYKDAIKSEVRKLRKSGIGLNQISTQVKVPKSTIRLWISDIKLTPTQTAKLKNKALIALQKGRLTAQHLTTQKRVKRETDLLIRGKKEIGDLSKRELLVAGAALYWAEGFKNKHEKRLGFCNSDPEMILFYLKWLSELGVEREKITARLSLNSSYKEKEFEVREYWSNITAIPVSQFTKTFYQNSIWKREYVDSNYHGVLRIHVKESLDKLLTMKGWIAGLKANV